MNPSNSPLRLIVVVGVLTAIAPSQSDRIVFTDGTVEKDVTVTEFNLREIQWRSRAGSQSRPSDRVADVEVAKVKDTYKRAYAAGASASGPATFLAQANELKSTPFLAQFGYVEAARLFISNEQYNDAFQCLEQLHANCPDSGFLPLMYRAKLDYYLAQGKARDAASVADKYLTAAQTQGYPRGFAVEAQYYKTMSDVAGGGVSNTQLRQSMRDVQQQAIDYPDVASRARLQIANASRAEGGIDEARREYEDLLERDNIPDEVRAGAWLGLGHISFLAGNPANKQPYYDALLAFLRVYVETPKASPMLVAEALFMGSQAAEKWDGPDGSRMGRQLRYTLQRDFPENPWTKR